MIKFTAILSALLVPGIVSCNSGQANQRSEPRVNLYDCEGCEAVNERAAGTLEWSTQIAGLDEPGKRLIITGTVYAVDGKTPQEGVVIYTHQTNAEGHYAGGSNESEWSRVHGKLRGWVRTGKDGRYRIDTVKPGPYPTLNMPAHIHMVVLEQGKRPYYIDDIVFDGEFGVTKKYHSQQEMRGGSGIVSLKPGVNGSLIAERDIVLEQHPAD